MRDAGAGEVLVVTAVFVVLADTAADFEAALGGDGHVAEGDQGVEVERKEKLKSKWAQLEAVAAARRTQPSPPSVVARWLLPLPAPAAISAKSLI